MQATVAELLVLVTLSQLTDCALAFCWKPNINPFMGIRHNIFGV